MFCYLWLPYMIIPVYGALERVPDSLIEDLTGPGRTDLADDTLRAAPTGAARHRGGLDLHVLADPGRLHHAAESGGAKANFIGNVMICTNIGIANNVPFAAAMALVPIVIMGLYLSGARVGVFEAL